MGFKARKLSGLSAAVFAAALPASASTAPVLAGRIGPIPVLPFPATAIDLGPNIFGTKAVPIRGERFKASWEHASEDASRAPLMRALIGPARSFTPGQKVAYVQSVVSKNIRWVSDTTQWRKHDYWASAAETLAAGCGDDEDRAIVKMQALRALGFDPNSLFLTLAQDKIGGPMAVVSIRTGGKFLILPDSGTAFLADSRRAEFKPLISIGAGKTYIHMGTAVRPKTVTATLR